MYSWVEFSTGTVMLTPLMLTLYFRMGTIPLAECKEHPKTQETFGPSSVLQSS